MFTIEYRTHIIQGRKICSPENGVEAKIFINRQKERHKEREREREAEIKMILYK